MFSKKWVAHRLEVWYPDRSVEQRNKIWNIRRFFMMTFLLSYVIYMWQVGEPSTIELLIHTVCYVFAMRLIMYTVEQMFHAEPKSLND